MFVNDNDDGLYVFVDCEGMEYIHVESLDSRLRKMKIITDNECVVIDRDTGELSIVDRNNA